MAHANVYNTEGMNDSDMKNDDKSEDTIDLAPKKNYGWYYYTYNVNNKYFINIQWKKGDPDHVNRKYGARRCTVNGKSVKILSRIRY